MVLVWQPTLAGEKKNNLELTRRGGGGRNLNSNKFGVSISNGKST